MRSMVEGAGIPHGFGGGFEGIPFPHRRLGRHLPL